MILSRLPCAFRTLHFGLRLSPALVLAFTASSCAMTPVPRRADWPPVPPASAAPPNPPVIVVGFVGGRVKHDNPIYSEVKLAERLRMEYPSGVYIATFENHHRGQALREIVKQLSSDHSDQLSGNEKKQARIILYGHSWGGCATVQLARELDKRGIPVLLTIQVDSVKRFGLDDSVIPSNVARAANFYQPHGLLHGRQEIRAADPAKTRILGNFRFDYQDHPIRCKEYPWYDRAFVNPHTEIECDPAVWFQVEALIRQQIDPAAAR